MSLRYVEPEIPGEMRILGLKSELESVCKRDEKQVLVECTGIRE